MNVVAWNGSKIAADGVYDMPIEAYHSDICAGPSISSSGLRTIENESPLHYWSSSYLNPEREPEADKSHFSLGRAAHSLLLGEEGFAARYVVRPDTYVDRKTGEIKPWHGSSNVCKEWLASQTLEVITNETLKAIVGMAKSLRSHPLIQAGLLNGEIERSLIWKDPETGVWLKARPDCIPGDGNIIADLKTTASADGLSCRRSIADYGYAMQLALVGMGMRHLLDREIGVDDFVLIFVETKPPYAVNVKPIGGEAIIFARRQLRRAIRIFAACLEKGEWPGYADDGVTAHLPDYLLNRLRAQAQAGELPEAQ